MPRVRDLLTEAYERTVVLGETGGGNKRLDRQFTQAGMDLTSEDGWVRTLALPLAYGSLVLGILATADLGSSSAVRWVLLLGS